MRCRLAVAAPIAVLAAGALIVPTSTATLFAQDAARRVAQFNFFANNTQGKLGALYLVRGAGRHSLVVSAEDQVVVVDTKSEARWGQPMLDKIENITDQPVKTIVNTNVRNAGSNAEFPTAVDIFAHENTKARLAKLEAFQGAKAKFLPNKTFTDRISFPVKTVGEDKGTNRVDMLYFGRGYTDGDAVVVFPQFGVAFMGDLFPDKEAPAIDVANGGSAVAFADTLAKAAAGLRQIPTVNILVPGKGPMPPVIIIPGWLKLADLDEYIEFNRAFLAAVKEAMASGKSADEAAATLTLPDKFKNYGMAHARDYVQAIYAELKK
jgi:glyoxylase-like metal-dependent hydrolase (beta-lactamase superfamily II)